VSYGLKIAAAPPGLESVVGEWIATFDYDAHGPDRAYPTGNGSSTDDPTLAMRFETAEEAWEAWRQPSAVTPTRPDGQPNRPMTVFTVSVEQIPAAGPVVVEDPQ
jgi:hypothetical protein